MKPPKTRQPKSLLRLKRSFHLISHCLIVRLSMSPPLLGLAPAAADAKTAVGPAHNLHRFRQPVTQAVARGSDRSSRRLMATVRLSVGRATDSHVAGAGHQARSPAPNACERLYPSAVDGHGAHGLRLFARRTHAHQRRQAPEHHSETLVVHYFMKTRRERSV